MNEFIDEQEIVSEKFPEIIFLKQQYTHFIQIYETSGK